MAGADRWLGGLQLATRTAGAFGRIGLDAALELAGSALPRTRQQIARPDAINALLRDYTPPGQTALPRVRDVRLPGVDFESSNCINFLVELDFETPSRVEGRARGPGGDRDTADAGADAGVDADGRPLPKTAYVKLPCEELFTRSFANTLGFWPLECTFCQRVARHIPIRIPRVYAAAQKGSRFVLLLENLHEIPGARLFINRDMASGTTPERAERVMRAFARLHAAFWGWSEAEREKILPAELNTFTAKRSREMTRSMNAASIAPAMRAAPDLIPERLGETYRLAMARWDRLLDAWYQGPLTLVHGDSHLGNCFEYPSDEGPQVGMIDFQATHWSKGMRDVQYFLINSMEPDVLEASEQALIELYCDELARHGVSLSRKDAFEQYTAFSFQTLMVGVVPLGLGSLTERDETVRAITRRSALAVERLGFREWLASLD